MQKLMILLVINSSSTCFGSQEVRLRFTACRFLSCCDCCDVGESDGKLCALCGVDCLTEWQRGTSATLPLSEPLPTTTTGHYTICCKKTQSCSP